MKTETVACDNFCGAKSFGATSQRLAPLDWLALVEGASTWTLCSRKCLVEFLFKSQKCMTLGTQVEAHLEGAVLHTLTPATTTSNR